MLRTRDFVLLFSAIAFLLMAIGTTVLTQSWSTAVDYGSVGEVAETGIEYEAFVSTTESLTRDERIASMRAKIAEQTILSESLPNFDLVTEEEVIDAEVSTSSTEIAAAVVGQCPTYQPYTGFWDARDLVWSESEGARVLLREVGATSSVMTAIVQLPMALQPAGNPSCLRSDVIGLANDGSLIRNDEVALYSIFGASTVVGYALDGFPIYGGSAAATDACGGRTVAGQYRYELSSECDSVLHCFTGAPITLP